MLHVQRFINELMSSNCYIIYEDGFSDCIVVDPASKECNNEIDFFKEKGLVPSYIILTHEHTDHTWGCNTLIEKYDSKVICSKACAERLDKESRAYFLFYYNDTEYKYHVKRVDIFIEDIHDKLRFHNHEIRFIYTPGHSIGSICFILNDKIFTGDTLMQYKPSIDKRICSKQIYESSLQIIINYAKETNGIIYPGHGEVFKLEDL